MVLCYGACNEIGGHHFEQLLLKDDTIKIMCSLCNKSTFMDYYYYRYSALGPVWAETRAQSGDWYGSGTLHPGQVLRGSLLLLSPAFRRSHFRHQVSPRRHEARDPSGGRWNCGRECCPVILPK